MINLQNAIETLRADLYQAYGHSVSADVIDSKLDEVVARHTASSTLEEFVPVLVGREVREFFGEPRLHVRFAAGANSELANAAMALTVKHAGDALFVDTAVAHPENAEDSHMSFVLGERGLADNSTRYLDEVRMVHMPDFIVYLGRDVVRDEAGRDIKIWDIADATTVEETRELADDLEARVLYMLDKLGIKSSAKDFAASA